MAKEGHPKFNPRPGQGLNPGPPWLVVRDLTNCANLAQILNCRCCTFQTGFSYFGLQSYSECWSGPNGKKTFARNGKSKHCIKGVGLSEANYVYRIVKRKPHKSARAVGSSEGLNNFVSWKRPLHGFRRHLGCGPVDAAKITANIWDFVQLSTPITPQL